MWTNPKFTGIRATVLCSVGEFVDNSANRSGCLRMVFCTNVITSTTIDVGLVSFVAVVEVHDVFVFVSHKPHE